MISIPDDTKLPNTNTPPVAISIAASDSCGGAGVQADIKTFQMGGCYGAGIITAVTCQNSSEIRAIFPMAPELVECQIRAVMEDLPVRAVKIGALINEGIIDSVERTLEEFKKKYSFMTVVDPVRIATEGTPLLESASEKRYRAFLSKADIITPNLAEAEWLLGRKIENERAKEEAAKDIFHMTGAVVLLKGGTKVSDEDTAFATDYFFDGITLLKNRIPRIFPERELHGGGCILSSAIAAALAAGSSLEHSISSSGQFIREAILSSWRPGLGQYLAVHSRIRC